MDTAVALEALVPRRRLSELIVRSHTNISRSRALIAACHVTVRVSRHIRRPRFAGGSDGADAAPQTFADPRTVRTSTKVKNGALPTDGARRRWVGPGRGERCNGCGDPISPRETEFELDFRDVLLLRLHAECFKAWESADGERR